MKNCVGRGSLHTPKQPNLKCHGTDGLEASAASFVLLPTRS
jgi:hypothetical protein